MIPDSGGGVTLVGHGYQGSDHYGLKDVTLDALSHEDFHAHPLPKGTLLNHGETRFNSWHFDGIIYGSHPSRVTSFRCVKTPKGPDLTVRFDDGTGRTMKAAPGTTAFISTAQLYDSLTPEEKMLADNSFWEPAPHPFRWSSSRGIRSTGLGVVPPGDGRKTVPLDELPPWKPENVHKYPLVWLNPVTGAKAFQVMPDLVRKLYLRHPKEEDEKVIEDEEEIRVWFNKIYDRFVDPESTS